MAFVKFYIPLIALILKTKQKLGQKKPRQDLNYRRKCIPDNENYTVIVFLNIA